MRGSDEYHGRHRQSVGVIIRSYEGKRCWLYTFVDIPIHEILNLILESRGLLIIAFQSIMMNIFQLSVHNIHNV